MYKGLDRILFRGGQARKEKNMYTTKSFINKKQYLFNNDLLGSLQNRFRYK